MGNKDAQKREKKKPKKKEAKIHGTRSGGEIVKKINPTSSS